MATLHFIVGKAGAGKTTLARRLGRELPAVVLCEDEWLSQLSDPITRVTARIRGQGSGTRDQEAIPATRIATADARSTLSGDN